MLATVLLAAGLCACEKADSGMERCDRTMLELKSEGVYAGDAIGLEGKVTWFEGDVTFRRSNGN